MQNYLFTDSVTKDICRVTEAYFSDCANLYVIQGKNEDLLIDSGLGLLNVKSFLKAKGFSPHLFLTHSHFDHSGGLKDFAASEVVVTSKILSHLQQRKFWGLEFLKSSSLSSVEVPGEREILPQEIINSLTVTIPDGLTPTTADEVSVGEYTFKVIPSPGHTTDSVVLYDHKHKILVTGDTLYDGELYAECIDSNKHDFIRSLQHLKTLDFQLVLPGHNRVLNRAEGLGVIQRWTTQLQASLVP